jgi:TatD DNase family protein
MISCGQLTVIEEPMLIDAHTHLDMYGDKLDSALAEIEKYRIFCLSNSMDLNSYDRALDLSRKCRYIIPSFGIHPWSAFNHAENLDDFTDTVRKTPMIGEIGLDYHWVENETHYPAQREVFEFFLAAAKALDKTINLHTKGAEKEILDLLIRYDIPRAIVHWYSGPLDIFNKMIDRGFYFTIGCEVSHSEVIQDLARRVPLELLLTETDNPGGVQWLTGEMGMPTLILDVVRELARLRKMTLEDISRIVEDNFLRLVQSDPWLPDAYAKAIDGIPGTKLDSR